MATGTPRDLAFLEALKAELATIATPTDDTDVQQVSIGDVGYTETSALPAIFISPLTEDYNQGPNSVLMAETARMRIELQCVVPFSDDPVTAALKLKRDAHQHILDWRDAHPADALDVQVVQTRYGAYTPNEGYAAFVAIMELRADYRATHSNLNEAT